MEGRISELQISPLYCLVRAAARAAFWAAPSSRASLTSLTSLSRSPFPRPVCTALKGTPPSAALTSVS